MALVVAMVGGCTPFLEGGTYYSRETGSYWDIDETGLSGSLALGVEFNDERWYTPSECGFYHRSMVNKRPEIETEDWGCKKRVRLK